MGRTTGRLSVFVLVFGCGVSVAAAQPPPGEAQQPVPPGYAPQQPPPPGYGQPGYGQAQPQYAQPQYAQPQPVYRRPVYAAPPNSRRGGRANIKTVVGGVVLFGGMYLATVSAWSILRDREGRPDPQNILFVPLIGPFLAIPDVDLVYADPTSAVTGLVWNGILQIVGLGGLIIGALGGGRNSGRASTTGPTFAVLPGVGPGVGSLEVRGTF